MGICSSPLRPLDKPRALLAIIDLIGESARTARSLTGYLDYAHGEPYWRPPRTEHHAEAGTFDRPYRAPTGTVTLGLEHLGSHLRELPTQTFVFVVSDFLEPAEERVWQRALEHRWELVPVVVEDPVWEASFPDIGGIAVPLAAPEGGVVPVHLSRGEARRLREENVARAEDRTRRFRALGCEPVLVDSHEPGDVLGSFLRWADLRLMARGAVA
jgi:hypothetical protein